MLDLTGIGELLIDFTPAGKSAQGNTLFEQNPGGGVANLVTAAARLGSRAAFIGKVGNDLFGNFLRDTIGGHGVDTSGLILSEEFPTTLAFVHLFENGERDFTFFRDYGADTRLSDSEVRLELITETRLLHFSSLTFTTDIAAAATLKAVKAARGEGKLVSYDPNWRPLLWRDEAHCKSGMSIGLDYADVIKVSEEELEFLTGCNDEKRAVGILFDKGARLVLVTRGANGISAYTPSAVVSSDAFKVEAVDTTGAGDACFGAFLHRMLEDGKTPEACETDWLAATLRFANAAAALCVTRKGAIPAMPTATQVEEFLAGR